MRNLYIFLALLFAAFAALQYNDPDPLIWIPAYGVVALFFVLAARGRLPRWPPIAWAVLLGVWMLTMVPGFIEWVRMGTPTITGSMKAEEPHIELVREFLGLLVAVLALVFLIVRGRRGA
ncbi:MAG: transmembrane 220 family protein [Flavobacteriales bacterium]|nr:transmembrane 220 family protein [Flavobacteriales bacterium]